VNNTLAPGASSRVALVNPQNTSLPDTFEAGLTVIRMILKVVINSETINQDNFGAFGAFLNVNFQAVDTILDLLDYYLHQNWTNVLTLANDSSQYWERNYDIRTARRIRGNDRQLDFAVTNNAGSAGSIKWSVDARLLLKAS